MPGDNVVKKVLWFKVTGVRKCGRPRLRWADSVESDLGIMNKRTWKTKVNKRKYGKYGGTSIVRTIKVSHIRWLDYLYRYPDAFPTEKVTFSKIEGTKRRCRCLEDVEKDLKLTRNNRWKAVVIDRVNWRRIRESALACKKLLSL
ncbi:hypothetical protein TNCV_3153501 [Trichonephila clavipes]|nr:hypothetical protein TNCV_3153501 [Trichonephila clavipes]